MKRFQRVCCALTALCLLLAALPAGRASAEEAWLWPVAGVYEMARGVGPGHGGIDISAEFGTTVMATKSGTVIESSNACPHVNYGGRSCWCNSGLGNYVKLRHDDGTYSRYMHLKQYTALSVGTHVRQGEPIGKSGSSGDSTGPHLHFDAYTVDNVRFFNNPTDARHTYHSENGINYVYSVIYSPSEPVLTVFPDKVQLGTPVRFTWGSGENTGSYTLTLLRRSGGAWQAVETVDNAASGLTRTLPAGEYRAELQAVNKGRGNNDPIHWKTADAEPVEFLVDDFTPEKPVLQLKQDAEGTVLVWEDAARANYHLLSAFLMKEDGYYHAQETLMHVESPLRVELPPGRWRVQLLAVNVELLDENGALQYLQADSDCLVFDLAPDCAGVHEIVREVTEPTCTACGYTQSSCAEDGLCWISDASAPLGHDWIDAGAVEDGQRTVLHSVCIRCGVEKTELLTEAPPEPCGEDCPAAQFEDLPKVGSWAHAGIDWAVANGITNGVDAAHFAPQDATTRGQIVTFLWRAAGSPLPEHEPQNPFTDVSPETYCYNAVLWAVENGIAMGTSSTAFEPMQPCTRAQLVTFLWRWLGYAPSEAELSFRDLFPGAFYERAVLWAAERGIVKGESETVFAPDKSCTREQAVTLLRRALCP